MASEFRARPIISGGALISTPMRADVGGAWEPWLDERALARHYGVVHDTAPAGRRPVWGRGSGCFRGEEAGQLLRCALKDCSRLGGPIRRRVERVEPIPTMLRKPCNAGLSSFQVKV